MKPQAYLTYEDQTRIAMRAHKLRAQAVAQAATAAKRWFREHLSFGAVHKA